MADIYEYHIYCITEGKYVTWYLADPPTKCCNDTSHEVNPNSIRRVGLVNPRNLQVGDSSPDEGTFQATTLRYVVSKPNSVPSTQTFDTSFPFDCYLWEITAQQNPSNLDDYFSISVAPNTPIGQLTTDVSTTETILNVTPTVVQYARRGNDISITDGVRLTSLGIIASTDKLTNTLTLKTAIAESFPAGSAILLTTLPLKDVYFDSPLRVSVGNKGLKAKVIPADTNIRTTYVCNTMPATDIIVYFQVQYYFL